MDTDKVAHLNNGILVRYLKEKKKDILNFAGKWMELEHIFPSEITQTQQEIRGMFSFISGL